MEKILRLLTKKTTWVGISGVASGIGLVAAGDYGSGIIAIIGGLTAITGRDAIMKLEK